MERKAVSGIMLTLLLIGMLTFAKIQPVKASGTIYIRADGSVDPPTAPISSVDNVTYTFIGNIYDSIVIERDNIIVDGNGYTLQGTGTGDGFYLNGRNNVAIKNTIIKTFYRGIYVRSSSYLSITGNNISNIELEGIWLGYSSNNNIVSQNNITAANQRGIWLYYHSNNNIISQNNIVNNDWGVWLADSSCNNTISQNSIKNNQYGIYIESVSLYNTLRQNSIVANIHRGIWLTSSSYNTIANNTALNNGDKGIFLGNSNDNLLANNIVSNSNYGFELSDSSNNILVGNIASNNFWSGISLWNSNSNAIYHNSFIDNIGWQAYLPAYPKSYNNIWDDGYPSGGNYWSNYNGTDLYSGPYQNLTGSDGIGDTPYGIDGNNQDNYPLIHLYGSIRNFDTNLTYLTIQSAINAPETLDGHTIFVSAGTYYENVVINKSVSLVGEDRETTIIDGMRVTQTVVNVIADNISVSGFTIQNARGQNVLVQGCTGISITGNIISKSRTWGILLGWDAHSNTIGENTIVGNPWGIQLAYSGESNIIRKNTIRGNGYGILMSFSSGNLVKDNELVNNWDYGIKVYRSRGNQIYHNNFIDNKEQASNEDSANTWDYGYPSGGNYWSDYTDVDEFSGSNQDIPGGDEIWDLPYVIDENNTDLYPLANPWSPPVGIRDVAVLDVIPSATEVYVGWIVNINVTVKNNGDFTENRTVTLYYNSTPIRTQTLTVDVGENVTLTFSWDTTDIAPGNYTIKAVVSMVLGEANITDNTLINGLIKVKMLGDVNGDNKVDIRDLATAALSFGTYRDHPRYDIQADINQDGKVDIKDLALIAKNFGKTYS